MRKMLAVLAVTILPMLAGCGDSGGDSSMPTAAVITFSSQGILNAGNGVRGFTATIELPAGVTAKTGTGGSVDTTVVVPSGLLGGSNGTMGPVIYTPATTTAKGTLNFSLLSTAAAGADVGEYATITLALSGVNPGVTDFNVTSFTPVDVRFEDLAGLTSKLNLSVH